MMVHFRHTTLLSVLVVVVTGTQDNTTSKRVLSDPIPATPGTTSVIGDSPWNHIPDNLTEFKSQVVALNLDICKLQCNLSQYTGFIGNRNLICDGCSCSETCEEMGNCCPDLVLLQNKTQNQVMPGCFESVLPEKDNFYLMVSRCPLSFNITTLKTNCENPSYTDWLSVVPRVDDLSGTSFRNIYCAQCHGRNNTSRWSTSVTCSSYDRTLQNAQSLSELFNATMTSKTCSIHFEPPDLDTQVCIPRASEIIGSCNVTGRWIHYEKNVDMACSMFSQVVFGEYRNIFCYYCNNFIDWEYISRETVDKIRDPTTVSLTALIDFDQTMQYRTNARSRNTDIQSNFSTNGSKVAYLKQCQNVSVTCAEGKQLDNDRCHSLFSASNMYGYRVCFQSNISFTNQLKSNDDLFFLLNWPRANDSLLETANVTATVLEIQNCPHKQMFVVVRYVLHVFSLITINRDDLEKRLLDDNQMILIESGVHIWHQAGCNSRAELALTLGEVYYCSEQITRFVFIYRYPLKMEAAKVQSGARYIQLSKQLICPRVVLNVSDYIITKHNSTLESGINRYLPNVFIPSTGRRLEHDKFQLLEDDSVVVCVNDYLDNTVLQSSSCLNVTVENTSQAVASLQLGLFSFVCTSISLLFLAMTFITYCMFDSMRTIGGLCNMGLVATLFAAQAVYEFGVEQNEDITGCQVIGILIHLLWLAAVLWMNACTFLLFLKLSFPLRCRNFVYNRKKILSLSALYAYGVSALIVCLNIITNLALQGNIGYGGNICYINTMYSKIYFFKVPLGIIVIVNIGLFVFTLCRIRRHASISSTKESKINLLACVKLSVITGLVWLSSYLYEIFHEVVFAYLFTLLVGAQGVLFFLAIVVNRTVCLRWLKVCRRSREMTSSSSAECGTSTNTTKSSSSGRQSEESNKTDRQRKDKRLNTRL